MIEMHINKWLSYKVQMEGAVMRIIMMQVELHTVGTLVRLLLKLYDLGLHCLLSPV